MTLQFSVRARAKGYALVTALIFLVLLTLVALVAIRGSGLEAKMSSNSTERTQAFESSELSRTLIETLLDANASYGGWPQSIGGTIPTSSWDAAALALLASCGNGFCITADSGVPRNWSVGNSECSSVSTCPAFTPTALAQDATYQMSIQAGSTPAIVVTAEMSIYKLRTAPGPGNNQNAGCGYTGAGHCDTKGTRLYFYVSSTGHESTAKDASTQTAAIFREIIK